MLSYLYVLKYNNYYNRIIKKEASIAEYLDKDLDYVYYQKINFYPKDGVSTTQVLNNISLVDISTKDYLIVANSSNNIISRWFIIESMQTRAGQYELTLKRDVIVDKYDEVMDADVYVEKATVSSNDVAIYNQEQISFNQIKKQEKLLKDKTSNAWIVGYYDASISEDKEVLVESVGVDCPVYSTLSEWEYYSYLNNSYNLVTDIKEIVATSINGLFNVLSGRNEIPGIVDKFYETHNYTNDVSLKNLDGKYIKVGTQYKKISVSEDEIKTNFIVVDGPSTNFFTFVQNALRGETLTDVDTKINYIKYTVTLTDVNFAGATFDFPHTANALEDAPYKMFCIPFSKIQVNGSSVAPYYFTLDNPFSTSLASSIAKALTKEVVYDVQLLPYCPINDIFVGTTVNISSLTSGEDYIEVKNNNEVLSIIFFPKRSTFSFDININLEEADTAVSKKIQNQCDMYRLCSPNYSAMFEFNLVKTGSIKKLNVDCTYKPFAPYIHINPVWSKLYGEDFNDARGLILQGDFSLPIVNDAWQQYQVNNKNYLNSFNRQVESIELNNKYAMVGDIAGAVGGSVQGAATGAMVGGVAGAIVGGVTSAAAGVADVSINEKLRRDALDLKKDQFNYSLENIKALPNTLAKVSAFDANNKIFPILEYYTCTDQEKEIFRKKLEFNGMTVMRIDKLSNFIIGNKNYTKGKLIRIDVDEDFHFVNDIADELNQGVYL